jgi:Ca-activated chloride channel homolog
MNFLSPLAFTLAILVPIIIAMYLLKLRRTEQVVSSTYLWQRMVRDVEANAPWQRLRRNLLLLLQLLFLVLLILVLARPFTWTTGSTGQAVILIFDTSASMAATDVRPNRLETAKDQAQLLISNLPENARGTIIAAGENTQVLVSSSQDKRQLYQALENLQIQAGSSDLASALELASAIAARQTDAEIVIYSDGKVDLPERLGLKGKIRYLPIGESGDNQAISLISLEPGDQEGAVAFIQVVNYTAEPVQRRLTISADDRLVDARDLEIPPKGQVSVISENIPPETEVLAATLAESDALSLDDQAWAVQPVYGNQNLTLISQGNRFLETALSLLPDLAIDTLRPEDFENTEFPDDTANLTIFDGYIPTNTLPSGNLFFIGPLSSTPYFAVTGSLETPIPQPAGENNPLLDYVDLEGISILNTARIPLPDWARPVLVDETSGASLLFVGETQGRRVAVLAFDPRHSDLPLQIAYPILIANLVDWLLPGRIGDIPGQIQTGEAVTFTPPPDTESLSVIRPDGSSTQLEIQEGRVTYADTAQLGVYRVTWGEDQSFSFAVNLANPQESDIQPAESLPLLEGASDGEATTTRQARREWWRPLAAIALVILVIEWLVYNRATLSKLWHSLRTLSRSSAETN